MATLIAAWTGGDRGHLGLATVPGMTDQRHVARRTLLAASAATAAAATTGLGVLPAAAAVDFAIWDPITDRSTATLTPRRVTMHIAVSTSADLYGPNKGPGGSYAHFYNPRSARIRQHQTLNRQAAADLNGNGTTISVEHQGMPGDSMTNSQLQELAKVFAWAHVFSGVPNRIATVDNTRGLAWHRLGIDGNLAPTTPTTARRGAERRRAPCGPAPSARLARRTTSSTRFPRCTAAHKSRLTLSNPLNNPATSVPPCCYSTRLRC